MCRRQAFADDTLRSLSTVASACRHGGFSGREGFGVRRSRPGPCRVRRTDLLATLRCYLDNARNRRQTAADLHVHANTVDYRLRQVGLLTGLDPIRDDQLPRLVAALVAFDARCSPG
jgi:hypothetical protein